MTRSTALHRPYRSSPTSAASAASVARALPARGPPRPPVVVLMVIRRGSVVVPEHVASSSDASAASSAHWSRRCKMTPHSSQSFGVVGGSWPSAACALRPRPQPQRVRGSTAADTIGGESRCDAIGSAAETDQQQSYALGAGRQLASCNTLGSPRSAALLLIAER